MHENGTQLLKTQHIHKRSTKNYSSSKGDSVRCKKHYHLSKTCLLVCHTKSWHRTVCNRVAEYQQVGMQHFHYNSCKISQSLHTTRSFGQAKEIHLLLSTQIALTFLSNTIAPKQNSKCEATDTTSRRHHGPFHTHKYTVCSPGLFLCVWFIQFAQQGDLSFHCFAPSRLLVGCNFLTFLCTSLNVYLKWKTDCKSESQVKFNSIKFIKPTNSLNNPKKCYSFFLFSSNP